MTWQPIETAPKEDKAEFLAATRWGLAVLCFVADRWETSGWRVGGSEDWLWQDDATHWMPLPDPPA